MRRQSILIAHIFSLVLFFGYVPTAFATHRIDAEVHYWVALNNINLAQVDEDGLAFLVSYYTCS